MNGIEKCVESIEANKIGSYGPKSNEGKNIEQKDEHIGNTNNYYNIVLKIN